MKILLTMNLPFTRIFGGANKSNKILVEKMAALGHDIHVVTPALAIPSNITIEEYRESIQSNNIEVTTKSDRYIFKSKGVEVHAVFEMEDLRHVLESEIKSFGADWIFVSAEDPSQLLLKTAIEISPDNIVYLAHTPQMLPFGPESMYPGKKRTELIGKSALIVTISEFVKDYISKHTDFNIFVNHPPHFDTQNVSKLGSFDNEYVLAMNPCNVKGIAILIELAEKFKNIKFAVVYGWGTTLEDKEKIKNIPNIEVFQNKESLDDLFENVKLFLMPTLWSEGFGMATVDAMLRGIPVLASDFGGLKEAKLGTEYLIPVNPILGFEDSFDENSLLKAIIPDQDIEPWKLALEILLTDKTEYNKQSDLSRDAAMNFATSLSVEPLVDHLIVLSKKKEEKAKNAKRLSEMSLEQKKILLKKVKKRKQQEKERLNTIDPISKKQYYDVSYSQIQLLLINEISSGFYGFLISNNIDFEGEFNIQALKYSFNEIIKRHESFRTQFIKVSGKYYQQILDNVSFDIEEIDLSSYEDKEIRSQQYLDKIFTERFNLSKAPLLRVKVLKLEERRFILLYTMHHIISDGLSMEVLTNEIFLLFYSYENKKALTLPPLPFQYKDYTEWQNKMFETNDNSIQKQYWHEKLKGDLPVLNLPIDYTRPAIKTYNGKQLSFNLSEEQSNKILLLGQKNGASLFMTLTAIVNILLYRYTGENDIIVGTPTSGRKSKALQNQIGFYVNLIALRNNINSSNEFELLLNNVINTCTEAYEHEEYPFDKLVNELILNRDLSHSPIFDVMVSMFNGNTDTNSQQSSTKEPENGTLTNGNVGSSHDMAFIFDKQDAEIHVNIVYNKDLFNDLKILHACGHFINIVNQITNNDKIRIGDINILTEQEKRELLTKFNETNMSFPKELLLQQQFESISEKYPDKLACKCNTEELTYCELNQRANQLAIKLRSLGVKPDDIIAIISDRSVETIVCILGAIKSGACYLPIDPGFPSERIKYTLKNSKCKILLLSQELHQDYENDTLYETLYLKNSFNNTNIENPSIVNSANDLAYIIYTSGSTGKPKGVMISHENVIRLFFNDHCLFDFSENDKWSLFHSFSFDFSVWELYGGLLFGGEVVIITKEIAQDTVSFLNLLEKEEITVLNQVPGAFYSLLEFETKKQSKNLKLRYVIFGGDTLHPHKLKDWKIKYPDTRLVNMYGITETTVHVTYKELNEEDIKGNISNIGKPIPTTSVYILDKNQNLLPIGIPGELCVSGNGLARGYLKEEELTNQKFISSPFEKGKLLYRSGDVAKYLANGDIEYLGRSDNQVQIRGFRIELGEIEFELKQYQGINDFAVVLKSLESEEKLIIAYIVLEKDFELNKEDLRRYLSQRLPSYMVPSYILEMDELPLTLNGKLDRKLLPLPSEISFIRDGNATFSNETEEKLLKIWEQVLDIKNISVNDDFFEIGGHSLRAVKVTALIQNEFDIKIRLGVFFENPTVRDLAKYILETNDLIIDKKSSIPKAKAKEYYSLSSAQLRLFIIQQIDLNSKAYNMPIILELQENIESYRVEEIFEKLILRHESLRSSFEIVNEKPVQKIHSNVAFRVDVFNTKNDNAESIREKFVRPFYLNKAPLIRVAVLEKDNGRRMLLIDMHHIICDGLSIITLRKEIDKLANNEELQPLKLQYKDYSEWINSDLYDENIQEQETFWINQYNRDLPVLDLPLDFKRPKLQSFEGATVNFVLTHEESKIIKNIVEENNMTLFMVILGIYNILLSKLSGQEEIIIGTTVATRGHLDLEPIVGVFVNTLALFNFPKGSKLLREYFLDIKKNTIEAFENKDYQFDELVNNVSANRDTSRNPIFDVLFAFDNQIGDVSEILGAGESQYHFSEIAKFDLTLSATDCGEQILLGFNYCTELFSKNRIDGFIAYFKQIVNQLKNGIDNTISSIDIITTEEKEQILHIFNNTYNDYPKDQSIYELFEEQALKNEGEIALVFNGKEITYKELKTLAEKIAANLLHNGVQNGSLVGVMIERSVELVASILGVLKVGAAYLPLDPKHPAERNQVILEKSKIIILLTDGEILENADVSNINVLSIKDTNLDILKCNVHVSGNDLAYVIYTSGSTGEPKGVMIENKNVVNFVFSMLRVLPVTKDDVYLSLTTVSFDIFGLEIFVPLLSGAKVVLGNSDEQMNPNLIPVLISKYNVSVLQLTPSRLKSIMIINTGIKALQRIGLLLIGGEEFPKDLFYSLKEIFIGGIFNMYGPTETTIWSTVKNLSNGFELNIGKPIDNTGIYILGPEKEIVPVDIVGELFISGDGVGRGYYNNEQLTKERFEQSPFKAGEILYKTGDIARWLSDGDIEFLGRIDNQVKIRGYRIELGEIENCLLESKLVQEAAVIAKKSVNSVKVLYAYIVPSQPNKDIVSEIKDYLFRKLPEYMIPSFFVELEHMPLNTSGKIDRNKLPEPKFITGSNLVLPASGIEQKLASIWSDILDIPLKEISADANFFGLGGHSISITVLVSRIHKLLGVKILFKEIFLNQTITELAKLIQKANIEKYLSIPKAELKEYYQLSSSQFRLFMLQQFDPHSIAYNMPGKILLASNADKNKIQETIIKLIKRHESFRTTFELSDGKPVQIVKDNFNFEIIERQIKEADLAVVNSDFVRPFDLAKGPLLRAELLRIIDGNKILLFDMHHIISDGASHMILENDFLKLYNSENLSPLKLQYRDFSEWQKSKQQKLNVKKQEKYWRDMFSGEIPVLALPIDYNRSAEQNFEGAAVGFILTNNESRILKKVENEYGLTLSMTLFAVYNIMLSKISGQDDIIIGMPISSRRHTELEDVVGMFVNTLAMRTQINSSDTLEAFLEQIKEEALKGYENQDYPFEDLVETLSLKRDASRNPVFDVAFNLLNYKTDEVDNQDIDADTYFHKSAVSKFDMILQVLDQRDRVYIEFEYSAKLFKPDTIEKFAKYFRKIISSFDKEGSSRLSDIEIIGSDEKQELLFGFNNSETKYPENKTIVELFEQQVLITPLNIALIFEGNSMTYNDLNEASNKIANNLIANGAKNEDVVGIICKRGFDVIISMLGVQKANCAYLPIDTDYPEQRKSYMLRDSRAKYLISTNNYLKEIDHDLKVTFIDLVNIGSYSSVKPPLKQKSDSLLYIIYTSGTTGNPKGVMVEHRNVVNLLFNNEQLFDFNERDVWTMFHSHCFDFSVWEMYGALLFGGRLVIIPKDVAIDTQSYLELLQKENVTILNHTPSAFYNLMNIELERPSSDLHIRYVIFGGEALSPGKLKQWYLKYPNVKLINMFGITETTVHVTYKEITLDDIEKGLSNIGKAIPGLTTYVLDKNMNPQPIGIAGELYVGGYGVARGYKENIKLTKERFISNPFLAGDRLYKTGDLATWQGNGELIYHGRIDAQVQLRGFRIELAEIKNNILALNGILDAVVIDRKNETGDVSICAYVVGDQSEKTISKDSLRLQLSKKLPDYMIPSNFVVLDEIPLTNNGKVDIRKLPEPIYAKVGESDFPLSEQEENMVQVWSKVLNIPKNKISIHANFFELGGHSLKTTILVSHIFKEFNVKLKLKDIFKYQTIRELVVLINDSKEEMYSSIKKVSDKDYYHLSSAQKRLFLLQQMDINSIAYNMPGVIELEESVDKSQVEAILNKLVLRHENLRTGFEIVNDEPVQKIMPNLSIAIKEYWITESEVKNRKKTFIHSFDLAKPPLLRVELLNIENGGAIMLFDIHHIISDGISHEILTNEFFKLFKGEELEPVTLQYKDYSEWQNSNAEKLKILEQEKYWVNRFSGDLPILSLPSDFSRPAIQTTTGALVSFDLTEDESQIIKTLAKKNNATIYMVILAVYNIWLSKLSGQEDIIVGTPIAGRRQAELESIVGLFINTIAMRNNPVSGKTITNFINEVKHNALLAYENQDFQFEELIDKISVKRDLSRNVLFDVMFNMPNQTDLGDIEEWTNNIANHEELNVKFDLNLKAYELKNRIGFILEYSTGLFGQETINKLVNHFKNIIRNIALKGEEVRIAELELISSKLKQKKIDYFNQELTYKLEHDTIQSRLANSFSLYGDKIAISSDDLMISYSVLYKRYKQISSRLLEQNVETGSFVGLYFNNKIDLIISILGILDCGCVFVPLDENLPVGRLKLLISEVGINYILTDNKDKNILDTLTGNSQNISTHIIDEEFFNEQRIIDNNRKVSSDDVAYIYFTSGSTGTPKGIKGRNIGLTQFIEWESEKMKVTSHTIFSQLINPGFDVYLRDIFTPLTNGASSVIPKTRDILLCNKALPNWVEKHAINLIHCVPSMFKVLSDGNIDSNRFKNLKYISLSGEQLNNSLLTKWYKTIGERVQLINIYGPTETTLAKMFHFIKPSDLNRERIPLGKTIDGARVILLDKEMNICDQGIVGEIYIRTPYQSHGYFNDSKLNNDKFIQNPFSNSKDLIYKTGDYGRELKDGNLEILGRMDNQIKIRGIRIELGEVEAAILKIPAVKETVVKCIEKGDDKYLCAYIVSENDKNFDITNIRKVLKDTLPLNSVPTFYVEMENLPLNANGKVNRKALPEPEIKTGEDFKVPINPTEEKLVNIWSEVLSVPKQAISTNSNFFEIGGHSLKATVMLSRIHKIFNVKLPLKTIFLEQTIEGLANQISESEKEKFSSIPQALPKDMYDLSSAQKRLYILQQLDLTSTAYNLPKRIVLPKDVIKSKIQDAFVKLIKRHDSFRTCFKSVEGIPFQKIEEQVQFEVKERQILKSDIDKASIEFIRSFDLTQAPLFRVELLRIENTDSLLQIDMHHIISDGTSQRILQEDFEKLYNGEDLPPLNLQYKDFSEWQNSQSQKDVIKKQEKYWLERFNEELPVLELPFDSIRPSIKSYEGANVSFVLGVEETTILKSFTKDNGLTLYMSLLSIYTILLAKLSGQQKIVVGTPIAARQHDDLNHIVGMFANTLAMHNQIREKDTLKLFLDELKEATIGAFENQEYQFEDLVEKIEVTRNTSRNPIFDVMFSFSDQSNTVNDAPIHKSNDYNHIEGVSKFDLTFSAIDCGEQLWLNFEYCTKIFKAETINRFIGYFKNILNQVCKSIDQEISTIEILSKEEKQQLLYDFNNTSAHYQKNKTIYELFEEQVDKTPESIAVSSNITTLTYSELKANSEKLAGVIKDKGFGQGDVVGLMVDRSVEMIIGIMGILKACCCYLPLMPKTPLSRIGYIVNDSDCKLILTQDPYIDIQLENVELLNLNELNSIETLQKKYDFNPNSNDLAYIIYTSGTTGTPKGVMIEHHSVINRLKWMQKMYPIGKGDVILQKTPFTFDVSIWELFWWSFEGAQVHMLEPEGQKDPEIIAKAINEQNINVIHFVPSMLESFCNVIHVISEKYNLSSLKYVFSSGEALKTNQVHNFYNLFIENTEVKLVNLYGPTEATVDVSFFECVRDVDYRNIPIGKPIDNTQLYILNKDSLKIQPLGVAGELMISGVGLSRGYVKKAELTAEKFIPNPFITGENLYRTGDLARWLPDGNIEYLGRIDHQVKIRGIRIELGEIESILLEHYSIKEAIVLAIEENGDKFLCAYIVYKNNKKQVNLRNYLARHLQEVMIPSYFVQLTSIPLTANGKVNRKALPKPEIKIGEDYVAPSNEIEEKLVDLWSQVLSLSKEYISVKANFFELGGHSLKATILTAKIHKQFGVMIPLQKVFEMPTITELSMFVFQNIELEEVEEEIEI